MGHNPCHVTPTLPVMALTSHNRKTMADAADTSEMGRATKRVRFDTSSIVTLFQKNNDDPPRIFKVPQKLVTLMKTNLSEGGEDLGLVFTVNSTVSSLAADICAYLISTPWSDFDVDTGEDRIKALPKEVRDLLEETMVELETVQESCTRHYVVMYI
jgi:hypothetical protein